MRLKNTRLNGKVSAFKTKAPPLNLKTTQKAEITAKKTKSPPIGRLTALSAGFYLFVLLRFYGKKVIYHSIHEGQSGEL